MAARVLLWVGMGDSPWKVAQRGQAKASKFWKARLGVDACSLDMTPWLNTLIGGGTSGLTAALRPIWRLCRPLPRRSRLPTTHGAGTGIELI